MGILISLNSTGGIDSTGDIYDTDNMNNIDNINSIGSIYDTDNMNKIDNTGDIDNVNSIYDIENMNKINNLVNLLTNIVSLVILICTVINVYLITLTDRNNVMLKTLAYSAIYVVFVLVVFSKTINAKNNRSECSR